MSFATGEDVMKCIEDLVRRLWAELLDVKSLPSKFPRMSYSDAMAKYGSDKPDIRLGMEVCTFTSPIRTNAAYHGRYHKSIIYCQSTSSARLDL